MKDYSRRRYRLPRQFILYFGTLEPRKNVASIIKAFTAIAPRIPHDLVIAGPRGWLTQSIDRAAASSDARERIHFIGAVQEAHKMAIYSLADLFVYPSFYEGFGFPPLESLLAGTPVITSYNSSLPEVVGEWATLINPYDPGELALAMRELLVQPVKVAPEVRRNVRERYSWRQSALSTLQVIERASQERVP
jgi:glycosyltransferase involved in cell wall biosynthesis